MNPSEFYIVWILAMVGAIAVAVRVFAALPKITRLPKRRRLASMSQLGDLDLVYCDLDTEPFQSIKLDNKPRIGGEKLVIIAKMDDLLALTLLLQKHKNAPMHVLVLRESAKNRGVEFEARVRYLQVLIAGLNAENGCEEQRVIFRVSEYLLASFVPEFTLVHLAFCILSVVVFVTFSWFSMMDPLTLKPNAAFHGTPMRTISYVTNIPIKLGVMHFLLYAVEFFFLILVDDNSLFATHVGQRMTSLWFQLIQPQRYGQHLQMHLETLMQVADCVAFQGKREHRAALHLFWSVVVCGVFVQNAMTSLAYHSMEEQALGFFLFMVKYLMFDLTEQGNMFNHQLGRMVAGSKRQVAGGVLLVSFVLMLNGMKPVHPTAMATLVFLGGAMVWAFVM